jgi:sirohydrochlorin cobaltochelatase
MSQRKALVVVDHGSRWPGGEAHLGELVATLKKMRPDDLVAGAHLEFSGPTVPAAIDEVVAQGARRVLVLPYLLLHGRHSRADLPRFAAEAEARHPGVAVSVGPPVGVSEVVLQVLLDAAQAVS